MILQFCNILTTGSQRFPVQQEPLCWFGHGAELCGHAITVRSCIQGSEFLCNCHFL